MVWPLETVGEPISASESMSEDAPIATLHSFVFATESDCLKIQASRATTAA
jgi:hypothetical protein